MTLKKAQKPLRQVWRAGLSRVALAAAAKEADAFLVSYPKSGRTWLRFILSKYFAQAMDLGIEVDLHSTFSILPNYSTDASRGFPGFRFAGKIPLILVSHLPYRRSLFLNKAVIFLVREPRDVLVSGFFHETRHKHRFDGDMTAFLESAQGIAALVAYLNSWATDLQRHRHIVVSYEQLAKDTAGVTAKILKFLGGKVDEAALAQAIDASRFEAMQRDEVRNGIPDHDYDRTDSDARRMRRGKAGGFVDYLSADQLSLIEARLASGLTAQAKELVNLTKPVVK